MGKPVYVHMNIYRFRGPKNILLKSTLRDNNVQNHKNNKSIRVRWTYKYVALRISMTRHPEGNVDESVNQLVIESVSKERVINM